MDLIRNLLNISKDESDQKLSRGVGVKKAQRLHTDGKKCTKSTLKIFDVSMLTADALDKYTRMTKLTHPFHFLIVCRRLHFCLLSLVLPLILYSKNKTTSCNGRLQNSTNK